MGIPHDINNRNGDMEENGEIIRLAHLLYGKLAANLMMLRSTTASLDDLLF